MNRPAPESAVGGGAPVAAAERGDAPPPELLLFHRGRELQRAGRAPEAIAAYEQALGLRPRFPEALNNLGQLHLQSGRLPPAERCFEQAARLAPDMAAPRFNLGELRRTQGRLLEAAAHYRAALGRDPGCSAAWNNLGVVLQMGGDPRAAAACFRRAVALDPARAEARFNLGGALREAGDLDGAARELLAALAIRPHYPEAHNTLGLVWKSAGAPRLAQTAFSAALALRPEMPEARWNRAFFRLLAGRLRDGWEDYEYRFAIPEWRRIYPFRIDLPRWDGRVMPEATLFVHDEQGFGDTFQFIRYLPRVRERCGRLIFETRAELLELLRGFPGVDRLVERPRTPAPRPAADACVALLSLPRIFGTTLETIPAAVPYLRPDPERVRRWAGRLRGPGPAVGIVWAGRPEHANDRNRSCPLDRFLPLLAAPGRRWYALQKGPAARQAQAEPFRGRLANLGPELADFADTAAVIANLDLLIAVDTAVVHLAGALGKPVWVLLSRLCDWRWLEGREESPWYPTLRLFRQPSAGDWDSVFRRVAAELDRLGQAPAA